MNPRNGRVSDSVLYSTNSTRQITLASLLCLAILVGLVASLAITYRTVFAAGPDAAAAIASPPTWEGPAQPDLSPNVISPMDPAIGDEIDSFGAMTPQPQPRPDVPGQPGGIYVWAAFLCVSKYSDADSTYLGYIPELLPAEGGLKPDTFSYLGKDRRVTSFYYQETDSGVRRLVLELNKPLEIDLTLYAGNMAFPFAASSTSELGQNARVWTLGSSLGWTPEQPVLVVLGGSYDMPMSQFGQGAIGYLGNLSFCEGPKETSSESIPGASVVWNAKLVVGDASDSIRTYQGYIPGNTPPKGELDDTVFTHDGVEYNIVALFYQEIGQARQLVLNADQQLPDDLIFEIEGAEFPVADSQKLGFNENIHSWHPDSSLDWTEGQELDVGLTQVEE